MYDMRWSVKATGLDILTDKYNFGLVLCMHATSKNQFVRIHGVFPSMVAILVSNKVGFCIGVRDNPIPLDRM